MTQDQAKTKWCPFVRHGDHGGGSFNRGSEASNALNEGRPGDNWMCNCIASACMAWRWHLSPRPLTDGLPHAGWTHISAEDTDDGAEFWVEPEELTQARRRGYCGLAGTPHA